MEDLVFISRKLLDHWIWHCGSFDKRSAWIDLILRAGDKDDIVHIGGETVTNLVGELITSKRELSSRWGWSEDMVDSFISKLREEKMIRIYEVYQDSFQIRINGYERS